MRDINRRLCREGKLGGETKRILESSYKSESRNNQRQGEIQRELGRIYANKTA